MLYLFQPPRWITWCFPRFTWRFSVSDQSIFITFDDGPHPDVTPFILDELNRFGWKATFFCVGENINRFPDLIARIQQEGHTIGNHTQVHTNGRKTSLNNYLKSFQEFEEHTPSSLFRPPYGAIRRNQATQILKTHSIILWSWLSYDYHQKISVNAILKKANKIKAGDILVLHDNAKLAEKQRELVPKLFEKLKTNGFHSKAITPSLFYKSER
jgi:peptidoglycan/xylan/chitin deacetylase (PgdA/CDA1 family)